MKLNDAGVYNLNDIFKGGVRDDNNSGVLSRRKRDINIPAYQRPYRWEESNIKQLFEDYFDDSLKKQASSDDSDNNEYFLGSSVIVEREDKGNLIFDVVDGQQIHCLS